MGRIWERGRFRAGAWKGKSEGVVDVENGEFMEKSELAYVGRSGTVPGMGQEVAEPDHAWKCRL